ncbi:MAG: YhbY family RNA-binding protein [Methanolinea sp.]|nr:YhbY family RNA-binding protein [Methanolinea sp.]
MGKEPGEQEIRATVWVGKNGLTDAVVGEIVQQLEKRQRVKVKWLRSTDVDPAALASRAGAKVLAVRGRTAVLEGEKKR